MSKTNERVPIASSADVVRVRNIVTLAAQKIGLRRLDQTKLVTAASEIARNTLIYGGGGSADVEIVNEAMRTGIRITFADDGPGIADLRLAMSDGYTSGNGMGLGLNGAKKLVDDFTIDTEVGRGTRITLTRWL